jgi:hypothetical protein
MKWHLEDLTLASVRPGSLCDLSSNLSGKHQRNHLIVAHERPEGILEGCRLVLLDNKVGDPSAGVAWNQTQREQPPPARRDEEDHSAEGQRRTNQMQQTSATAAVFGDIEWPELGE